VLGGWRWRRLQAIPFAKEAAMAGTDAPTLNRRQLPERRAEVRLQRPSLGAVDYIAMALLIVGGLNWAMVGLFDIDIVATLFGQRTPGTRLVYVLVGVAALYSIYLAARITARKT
jgi:uncharacterized membrane protein YuzA (DUF378 family)